MDCTSLTIVACADSGQADSEMLSAVIDDTTKENVIVRKCWAYLRNLPLVPTPLETERVLRDSHGVLYTVRSKVRLLIHQENATSSYDDWFYVSERESSAGVEHDVVLGESWKGKFRIPDPDGRKIYHAAPTELQRGNKSAKQLGEERAAKREQQHIKAKASDEAYKKRLEESKEKSRSKAK